MIAAIDGNPAAWFDLLSRQPGARVGACWVVTDDPFPLCNSVFFPDVSQVDAALADVPQLWWLGSAPDAVLDALDERGVIVDEEELPGMARSLSVPLPAVAPSPLRIVSGLDGFDVPFGASYGIPPSALASIMAAFGAYGVSSDVRHFVGWLGDEPVACASIIVRDGVCGLYDVGTVPEVRGRGFGTALTVHALRVGAAMGASDAILHSSPLGMPIYRRLGFEVVATTGTVVTGPA